MTTAPDKASEEAMDMAAANQRITWLDEERRRDHSELARLTQEMASALAVLKEQAVKLRETGDRVNAIETGLARVARLEDAITAARSEIIPLRDADVRLQDDIQRQAKEHQVQTDQTTRLAGEFNTRLDAVGKTVDGLVHRIQALDIQQKDHAGRLGEVATRLEALAASADLLTGRLQLLETREHERLTREGAVPAQIASLANGAEALSGRIKLLETREHERLTREGAVPAQIASLASGAEALSGRIKLLETREHERLNRESTIPAQIDNLVKGAVELSGRLQILETREQARASGDSALQAQMSRLDVSQSQAIEEVKRSVARAETLMTDIQQLRREIVLARDEEAKKHRDDSGIVSELREAVSANQRRIEEVADSSEPILVRLQRLEESAPLADDLNKRLLAAEEQLSVVQATYKGLQEVEDRHWNTDIPMIERVVEEASNTTQSSAATVNELVAASQALRESVRELQVNLGTEHVFAQELAAALRGLIEEDLQTRLATTQKQLQTLRRLANAPVEGTRTDEQ